MSDEEVNRIIAEFMGVSEVLNGANCPTCGYDGLWDSSNEKTKNFYTKSLDALVSVWEKLDLLPSFFKCDQYDDQDYEVRISINNRYVWGNNINIQQAAAYATAKAILELKEK